MSAPTTAVRRRVLAGTVGLLLAAGTLALVPAPARADSAPVLPSPANPVTVTADALPTTQIDGVGWAQAIVGDTVYVGGAFTSARPAGAPAGTGETPRSNLLAYDVRTGELISSFAPVVNGQVLAVAASPDGSRLHIGGDFTAVDGQTRNRVAAFDTATGALVAGWSPSVSSQVRAIAATNGTVYLGGSITAVGGVSRTRLAAVRASDGGLLPWAPVPGTGPTTGNRNPDPALNSRTSNDVMALVVTGGGDQVVAGGRFDTMNGTKATGVAALDGVTGATRPFAVNQLITNQGAFSAVHSLSTDGSTVYGTAYDYNGPGNMEGSFAATAEGGQVVAINDCHGDTYSSHAMGGALYLAGHSHDCEQIGGYPEQNPRVHRYAVALTTGATGGTNGPGTLRSGNFYGQPAPSLLDWFPTMTPGEVTGQFQAGWSVTGNGRYLVYAGEFPRVNGVGQAGLVRYALPDTAPNRVGPNADGFTAGAALTAPGTAQVSFRATSDQDNEWLTYRVYRDSETAANLVAELTRASTWWSRPLVSVTDPAATATSRYRVVATDPFGNRAVTPWTAVDPAGVPATPSYRDAVAADGALEHWRLGETPAQLAAAGNLAPGAMGLAPLMAMPGVTAGVPGALTGDADTAYSLDGTPAGYLVLPAQFPPLDTVTVEAWFRTDSAAGGLIAGFGDAMTGTSTVVDRLTWLDADGRVNFGVSPEAGVRRTVTSEESYADGEWHLVASTLSPAGMFLYVDGELAGSRTDTTRGLTRNSYFRVGGDATWTEGVGYLDGDLDEVAVYLSPTTSARAEEHFLVGTTGAEPNLAPRAAFTTATAGLALTVDGRFSRDPDGDTVTASWNWGDGSPAGSGATASHTYSAPGTYTVVLTATDAGGATSTARQQVTVTRANQPPTAAFTATPAGLTVSVDAAGSADADGTVAAHAWDWGDGTAAGSGATASHDYAAAGTYTVTLTVTDDDGATAQTTRVVTVSAPAGPQVLAADAFGRSVTGGLGTADVGGAWTPLVGASRQSVAGGTAVLTLAKGNNAGSHLGGVSATDVDLRTTVSLSAVPNGGSGALAFVTGRRVGTAQYNARLQVSPTGAITVALLREVGGVESQLGAAVTLAGPAYTAGTPLQVHLEVTGTAPTALELTVWRGGSAEPATPTLTRTDATAGLQAPGSVGLAGYLSGSATAPVAVRFDDLRVTAPGTAQPPANAAPVAAFTAQATGLSVAVDGAGSADADGTVASYAWAWGDGTPAGSGATATHAYAAAGTYPVTLTVTDDDGATATTTRSVTVTAPEGPQQPQVLAADAFGRTVSGGLGTADVGGAWTATAGASRLSVAGGTAVLNLPGAGNETAAHLGAVRTSTADVRATVTLASTPTGNGTYAFVTGRRVAAGEEYTVRVRVAADGGVWLALSRTTGNVETFPGGEVRATGLTWTPGTPLAVRVQVSGTGTTTITGSVWAAGSAEPAAPQLSRTDTTAALQQPGSVGVGAYRPGGATAATSVRVDDLTVTAVGATPPPPNAAPVAAFTAQPTGLAVAVDGTGSTDADGTVAVHAWSWGDGTAAGSGATASHTYAAAGTYTVTLTVTDDDGATASTTRSVTVTAPEGPAQPQVLAADAFGRTVSGGLGTADVGGAWTASSGAGRLSVDGGAAVLGLPGAGNVTGAHLPGVASTAVDLRTAFTLSAAPTGATGTVVTLTGRRVGAGQEYSVRVRVAADGGVWLALSRVTGGVESFPGGEVRVAGLTWTPGTALAVQVRVTGTGTTTVTGKVWALGAAEPTAPQLTRTDTTAALQAPGGVGLAAWRPSTNTAATAVRVDDLTVTAAQ
ncbi:MULTISPECIES: PKD domain-containing protein [unclassified Blastococcus]